MMPLGSARSASTGHTHSRTPSPSQTTWTRTFPFRIYTVRTDRGHEFQALFHWHLADQGIQHVYIKPRTPQLNGKVERSHRTDQQEFYQLLSYKGDVDLEQRLAEWERFYNFGRPHGAFAGQTPYEALRERLQPRISDLALVPYRQDQSLRLEFWGSDVSNHTTEGDTRWVNYNTSHSSSRSTAS